MTDRWISHDMSMVYGERHATLRRVQPSRSQHRRGTTHGRGPDRGRPMTNIRKQVRVAEARAKAAAEPVVRATLALELPKVRVPFDPRSECAAWDDTTGGAKLWLLSAEQLPLVPEGSALVTVTSKVVIVGIDHIDTDTRCGWLSCGLLDAQIAEAEQ